MFSPIVALAPPAVSAVLMSYRHGKLDSSVFWHCTAGLNDRLAFAEYSQTTRAPQLFWTAPRAPRFRTQMIPDQRYAGSRGHALPGSGRHPGLSGGNHVVRRPVSSS